MLGPRYDKTMNVADEKAIRQGIEVAERQIAEIDARLAEIKALSDRRTTLEAYITHAKSLLGEGLTTHIRVRSGDSLAINVHDLISAVDDKEPRPIWADAVPILVKAKGPMTVPQIVEGMKAAGREFGAANVTEVVRGALNRRPDVFENIGRGLYAIKTWPAELKKRTEGAP